MLLEVNFTMVVFAVSFLIFIYLLNLTLFKPVGKVVKDRKNLIEGSYTTAKQTSEEISSILISYEQKIKEARLDAKKIVDEASEDTKLKKASRVAEVLQTLKNEKQSAIKRIQEEQKLRGDELKGKINELKDLITNKIIGKELISA